MLVQQTKVYKYLGEHSFITNNLVISGCSWEAFVFLWTLKIV